LLRTFVTTPPSTSTYTLSLHDALPIYGPDIGPVHAHDTVPGFLPLVEKGVLLGQYLLGRPPPAILVSGHRYRMPCFQPVRLAIEDRKSTRLNSSHVKISYAVFCLNKK